MTLLVQLVVLLVGIVAGFVWTRQSPVLSRATLVNLATGALLYPLRLGLTLLGVNELNVGLIPLGTLVHPALQLLLVFLVLDFCRYWLHYAHHRVPFLWRFHRVHHSAEQVDATLGLRMHVVDFLQLTALPILLFGVLFDISAFAPWVLPVVLSLGIVADGCEHANVRFPLDTAWRRAWYVCWNSPLFHSWHHVREGRLCDGNYATCLPLWDRLFGTAILRDAPPAAYGIESDQALQEGPIALQLLRRR